MPEQSPTTHAALWIGLLLKQFPELSAELAPGRTTPAHRPAAPAPADLAERLREEREEALLLQQRHGLVALGHSAAPLRLHISDTIRDITDGVTELEEAVRDRLGLPRVRRASVAERLRRIAALLDGIDADPVLAAHVRDETRRMARRCARALGDTETVVRVSGRCPWCDSVSLRAFPDRGAVLCINPACRCTAPLCGCHDDPAYRHTWEEGEWERAAATGKNATGSAAGASPDTGSPVSGAPVTGAFGTGSSASGVSVTGASGTGSSASGVSVTGASGTGSSASGVSVTGASGTG
ncbi:hypothetical protein, partial [Streptomyces sp. NPDC018967]|uniref:hypothetical protein n=1 Tax=Streptomyces sp. NPDC018967 TaxID=3365059 RepID=UPI0037BD484B